MKAFALAALTVFATDASAQTPPIGDQPPPPRVAAARPAVQPWTAIVEAGVSDVHGRTEADGFGGGLRLQRRLFGYNWMRAEVAFTGGTADENFGTAELGLEFRHRVWGRFTGFLGLGGGFLKEEHWEGGMLRANVGVEARVWKRLSVRAAVQAGTHDGIRGPHLATLGLAWGFGRPAN
jgi:hypothetical protein